MQNYAAHVKKVLMSFIDEMSQNLSSFVKNPGKDFTRNRKLSFHKMLLMLISMGGNTIGEELLQFHKLASNTATSAAFVQQRDKLLPSAFEFLFQEFTRSFPTSKRFNGYRLLAVDGSDLHIPTNENDADTYFKSSENARGFNLLHLNALFDLCNKNYESVFIQPRRQGNEHKALLPMIDRSESDESDDNSYETLVTNLSESEFPPEVLGEIYKMRWGIETSFRELKYSIGLLSFHSKKVEYILQEIYARVIAYNFSMIIVMSITLPTRDRKYKYQANFVLAAHICVYFLRSDDVSPHDVEALIMKNILPIRKGRKNKRRLKSKSAISFVYRIA